MKLPKYFAPFENIDFFEEEKCVQYWAHGDIHFPYEPGIVRFNGKWYVWPPEFFDRSDPDHILLWLAFEKPYKTRHAAAVACMFLYPE